MGVPIPTWLEANPDEAGGAPLAKPKPPKTRVPFTPVRRDELVCSLKEVEANLASKEFALLDARPQGRFEGTGLEPYDGVQNGHIPGALNVPFRSLIETGGTYKEPSKLKAALAEAGVPEDMPLVVYCGSGVQAAIIAVALDALGRESALYDGSWAEWGRDGSGRPIVGEYGEDGRRRLAGAPPPPTLCVLLSRTPNLPIGHTPFFLYITCITFFVAGQRGEEMKGALPANTCRVLPACGGGADRRRRLVVASGAEPCFGAAVCVASLRTQRWLDDWRLRLDDWFKGLPLAEQASLGNCLGALGLHLGSRFDMALNAWRALLGRPPTVPPPHASATTAEPGCEWLGEGNSLQVPEFPPFPSDPDTFHAPVLPIPSLLPEGSRHLFLQSTRGYGEHAREHAPPDAVAGHAIAVAVGAGAAGALLATAAWVGIGARVCRAAKRGRVTLRLESASDSKGGSR